MKTAISIPDPLFESAERLARRLGISRSMLFQRAVMAYLEMHKGEGVTEALNELYGPDDRSSRLDPALGHLQFTSIPEEEW